MLLQRASDRGTELCRLLERCVKESGSVDMESLCVRSGDRVWAVRVDVHVLDDDGALPDVASVAVCAALAHSRRPDVTVRDDDLIIVSGY
jgi:exosome complex component RRP45